jgi:hypothetical protein
MTCFTAIRTCMISKNARVAWPEGKPNNVRHAMTDYEQFKNHKS